MTAPIYYVRPQQQASSLVETGIDTLVSGLNSFMQSAVGASPVIRFVWNVGGSFYSGELEVHYEQVVLENEVVGHNLTIADTTITLAAAVIDVAAIGLVTAAITQGMVAAGTLIGLGATIAGLPVTVGVIAGAAVLAAVTYVYNENFDDVAFDFIESLTGTVNIDLQLRDANGNVLGGALYKDGLGEGLTEVAAVSNLLVNTVSGGLSLALHEGMKVGVLQGHQATETNAYTIADASFFAKIVEHSTDSLAQFLSRKVGADLTNGERQITVDSTTWMLLDQDDLVAINVGGAAHYTSIAGFAADAIQIEGEVFLGDTLATAKNNYIVGDANGNTLNGEGGDDYIYGEAGLDTLIGGTGNDHLFAGTTNLENDVLDGGWGDDVLFGSLGNNLLEGGLGNDIVLGRQGNDTFIGSFGSDVLVGGSGIDTAIFNYDIAPTLIEITDAVPDFSSGFHQDVGAPYLSADINFSNAISVDGAYLNSIEHIFASDVADLLTITDLSASSIGDLEWIDLGDEFIENDFLDDDEVDASALSDDLVLDIESVLNQQIGLANDPSVSLVVRNAELFRTGSGNDFIKASGLDNSKVTEIHAGAGNDTIEAANSWTTVYGGSGNDTIVGNAGVGDYLHGGDKNSNDLFNLSDGLDTVDYSKIEGPIRVVYSSREASPGLWVQHGDQLTGDELTSIERIVGTAGQDVLKIVGDISADTQLEIDAFGGQGPDGEEGSRDDIIDASGADREIEIHVGANGEGYIRNKPADEGSQSPGGGQITLKNFNTSIIGSDFSDLLVDFKVSEKSIDGGGGDDYIAVAGHGEVDGGMGDDLIFAYAPQYIDNGDGTYSRLELDGGAGDDTLTSIGGLGAALYGGSGNDTLFAWTFGAELYGGEGEDHFIWSPNTLVGDGEGHDRLSLFGIIPLTGGLAYGGEESEWAAQSFFPFIKYGLNTDGELVVNFLGEEMYVADYTGGPGAETNTLGIYVAALEFDFYRLIFDRPAIEATPLNEILTAMFKTMGIVDADDPLMLDLDGDGLEFTTLGQSETYFDLDGDGFAENTGWLRSDDGMLVLDRNGNGNIDDISELFGAPGVAGFTELTELDSNTDGVIDANDARFAELQVWRDLDQDGVSDAGELFSLAELDIVSFDLNATAMDVQTSTDHSLRAQASFTRGDGTQGDMFEVILNSSQFETRYLGDHGIADWAKDLPDVKGYGLMTDLKLAAANDFELAELTENLVANLTATNLEDLVSAVQPILLAWNDANPGSRELAPVLVQTDANGTQRLDYGVYEEDGSGGYWRLDSGAPVLDGSGVAIARPTLEDILGQTAGTGQSWQLQQIWSPERDADTTDRVETPYRVTVDSEGVVSILDHGVYVEDAQGGYWQLASGAAILDVNGVLIARPTLEEVLAQTAAEGESWRLEVFADAAQSAQVNDMAVFYDAAGTSIYDYAVFVADGAGGGYWASAREVSAAAGAGLTAPAGPTHADLQSFVDLYSAQLGATSAHAEVIDADRARYAAKTGGVNLGDLTTLVSGTDESGVILYNHNLDQQREFLTELIARFDYWEEAVAVRLAMQGGLSNFFQEIEYDAEADIFRATGERELIPIFEAIFVAAPGDATGALSYLEDWKPILDVVYVDFGRHGAGEMSASFLFANVVAAYESQGLAVGLMAAADILGVPTEQIIADSTDGAIVSGDAEDNIFYLSTGDQVFKGGNGRDVYVIGKNFGSDVIEDIEAPFSNRGQDSVRFADIKSTDVSARREGIDLIIRVDATGDELRIVDQFEGRLPAPPVVDASNDTGVVEIIFADGVVWNMVEMAFAVSNPLASDDVLIGTNEIDVLDGGTGDDTLSGGVESDIYIYNMGYGNDVIEENDDNILVKHYDMVKFGEGIEKDSLVFHRDGPSNDLTITFDTAGDSLTLINQFDAAYLGSGSSIWLDRVELFTFDDGSSFLWSDIMEKMVADGKTDGDDTIYGFAYEDRLDGGAGNDFLSGGNESDTYIFGEGYGQDIIEEDQGNIYSGNEDRVVFAGNILQSDIIFTRDADSDDLVIELAGTTDTLTLRNQFSYAHPGIGDPIFFDQIEYFQFSDEHFLNAREVEELLLLQSSTEGADSIYGFAQKDRLDGGLGDDYLAGGADSDTYVFARGYGRDTIHDNEENILFNDVDIVEFGAGIAPSDLTLSRDGDVLHIDINGTTDRLTIEKQFSANNLGIRLFQIEEFHFVDSTVWTAWDVQELLLNDGATDGDDVLIGFFGTDILDGGAGNDSLVGGNGSDTYIFGRGYGQDVAEELATSIFADEGDQIVFRDDIAVTDLVLSHIGDDLIFEIVGTSDSLTVIDQFATNNLGYRLQEIETFAFADGTTWTVAQVQDMLLQSTDGDDTLVGFYGADTLDGGLGNDRLEGGNGGDTYIFNAGYGQDVIEDYQTSIFDNTPDVVQFGAGLLASDIVLNRVGTNGRDLEVTFTGNTDRLLIQNMLFTSFYEIEEFHFADGEIWNLGDIWGALLGATDGNDVIVGTGGSDVLSGLAGDDTLTGKNGNDTLIGGEGNDRLIGSDGSDTYVFSRGDGMDVIDDNGFADTDRLIIHGYLPSEVTLGRSAPGSNHLVLTFAGTTDQITVVNALDNGAGDNIEQYIFDDGTIWLPDHLRATLINESQTTGDDLIHGFKTSDVLEGGLGNDELHGGGGSDDYIFTRGDGVDLIEDDGYLSTDRLVIHGYTPDEVSIGRTSLTSNHVVLTFDGTGDQITIRNTLDGSTLDTIEQIVFDDATIWTPAELRAALLTGGDGDDSLYGFKTADTLDGGLGNDRMEGGFGGDTYVFDSGYGDDVIKDAGFNGDFDKVVFGSGILAADLSLSYSSVNASHLVVEVISTGDSLTIERMFDNSGYHIEAFEFSDGSSWDRTEIIAAIAPPPAAAAQASGDLFADFRTLRDLFGDTEFSNAVASDTGLSLADLIDEPGLQEGESLEAQIVTLVDPHGVDTPVSPGGSAGDADLTSPILFEAALVMPELPTEDYSATQ